MKLKDKVIALYEEGKKPMDIARELKESPFVVRQMLKNVRLK